MTIFRRGHILAYHVGAWLFFGTLFFFYISQRLYYTELTYRLGMTLVSFGSYAFIIYGYVYGIYPKFRIRKTSRAQLFASSGLLFTAMVLLRMYLEHVWIRSLSVRSDSIFNWGSTHFSYTLTTSFVALLIGFLFTSLEEKIIMQKKQEIMRRQQVEAELQLLKYQLQPHFLFNFLNNLYGSVYKTLPDVAEQIEKGAELMRYYLYNTTRNLVPISSETAYIKNIIDLEKTRFSQNHTIICELNITEEVLVPPMLFAPILENLFKHGLPVDRAGHAWIELQASRKGIIFCVTNLTDTSNSFKKEVSGTGLQNLKDRLNILYGATFELRSEKKQDKFITTLILPPYENSVRHN